VSLRFRHSPTEAWLLQEHGPVLSAGATAKLMGFRSVDALRQARRSNRLPVQMFMIEGRRGWFSSTQDVAAWLEAAAKPIRLCNVEP
jgi:hypothetical protein